MSRERLAQIIKKNAEQSFEARQVAKRLAQLLPNRLKSIKNKYARKVPKRSLSERYALISEEYIDHLDEMSQLNFQALSARIEYETHVMLFQARQTIAKLRR